MITINLLPAEYRVPDTTSPTRILVIAASVLIGIISCAFYLFVHLHELENAKKELADKEAEARREMVHRKTNQNLQQVIQGFEARDKAVDSAQALRVPFSKKLYEFAELMANGSHPVWLNNLNIVGVQQQGQSRRGRKPAPAGLPTFAWRGSSICAAETMNKANTFYRAILQDKAFYQDFVESEVPRYTRSEISGEYVQKISWNFNLNMKMQMQPPEDPETSKSKVRR